MSTPYFISYLSFMDILDYKVEFLDERHFLVDENAGFKWFEITEDSFEKADIKLHYHILSKEGKKVFSLDSYDCLLWTLGKYLLVSRGCMHGLIDIKGNEIVPPGYDYICKIYGDLFFARKGGKEGIFDVSGNEIVPFIYDRIDYFFEGLAKVEMGDRFGFIDREGNLVIPCKYD
ncbi:MAG TPA: WG repeat-containing protein, partial [Spirochaetes bacterium]|nr:WG repeat-containing protein [Spirochaetota bacterium]